MTANEPIILAPENYPTPLQVIGTQITVLASNDQTRSYEVTFQEGAAGMGPPPHNHAWDESFYVLRGEVQFTCAGKTQLCGAGTLVHVPAKVTHSFQYGSVGGAMLEITGAGGRATQMFTSLSREIPPGPPEISKVVSVLAANGVSVDL